MRPDRYSQQPGKRKPNRRLDADTVRSIRRDWETTETPNRDLLGRKYGVSISTIDAIVRHRIWKGIE